MGGPLTEASQGHVSNSRALLIVYQRQCFLSSLWWNQRVLRKTVETSAVYLGQGTRVSVASSSRDFSPEENMFAMSMNSKEHISPYVCMGKI